LKNCSGNGKSLRDWRNLPNGMSLIMEYAFKGSIAAEVLESSLRSEVVAPRVRLGPGRSGRGSEPKVLNGSIMNRNESMGLKCKSNERTSQAKGT
jgi:hypothetical protein